MDLDDYDFSKAAADRLDEALGDCNVVPREVVKRVAVYCGAFGYVVGLITGLLLEAELRNYKPGTRGH